MATGAQAAVQASVPHHSQPIHLAARRAVTQSMIALHYDPILLDICGRGRQPAISKQIGFSFALESDAGLPCASSLKELERARSAAMSRTLHA